MIYGYCRISTKKQSIERQERNIKSAYPEAFILKEVFTGTKINRKEWNRLESIIKSGDTIVFDSVSRMSRNAEEGFQTYESMFNRGINLVFLKEPHINTDTYKGDTIVFDSVSRMSRNAEEGFQTYESMFNRGINLVFLKEPHINTDTYKKAMQNQVQMTGSTVDLILEGVNKYLLALAKEQIKLAFEQSEKEVADLQQRTREGIQTARLNGKQIGQEQGKKLTTKKCKDCKPIILKHSKDFNGTLDDTEVMKLTGLSRNTYYKYKRELKQEI